MGHAWPDKSQELPKANQIELLETAIKTEQNDVNLICTEYETADHESFRSSKTKNEFSFARQFFSAEIHLTQSRSKLGCLIPSVTYFQEPTSLSKVSPEFM